TTHRGDDPVRDGDPPAGDLPAGVVDGGEKGRAGDQEVGRRGPCGRLRHGSAMDVSMNWLVTMSAADRSAGTSCFFAAKIGFSTPIVRVTRSMSKSPSVEFVPLPTSFRSFIEVTAAAFASAVI